MTIYIFQTPTLYTRVSSSHYQSMNIMPYSVQCTFPHTDRSHGSLEAIMRLISVLPGTLPKLDTFSCHYLAFQVSSAALTTNNQPADVWGWKTLPKTSELRQAKHSTITASAASNVYGFFFQMFSLGNHPSDLLAPLFLNPGTVCLKLLWDLKIDMLMKMQYPCNTNGCRI